MEKPFIHSIHINAACGEEPTIQINGIVTLAMLKPSLYHLELATKQWADAKLPK